MFFSAFSKASLTSLNSFLILWLTSSMYASGKSLVKAILIALLKSNSYSSYSLYTSKATKKECTT
ncbi:MAG TPA: hypothetical protein PKI46_06495 [Bacteroidales bacterium]|nr:hypothetical protein [Bacteroidales bacterium]